MCLSDEWNKWTDCCEDEAVVSAMSSGKRSAWGDLHKRGGEKCKKAFGQMRVHGHVKSNSSSVLIADLSGPRPKAVGTGYTYLFV
eukprot:418017-Prorocentrum_lima.AAC.1